MHRDFGLLEAWRGGDKAAGNELFDAHFLAVCNFFRNKVADGVDDLTQRTFVTALEAGENYRGDGSFRSYLLGTARRVLLRHYREKNRDARAFEPLQTSVCDLDPSPSVLLAARREHGALLDALRRLPIDLQIALELHYWEAMTLREIADVLEVPQGTAASRVRRGKELLRETMGQGDGPPPEDADLQRWAEQIRDELAGADAR